MVDSDNINNVSFAKLEAKVETIFEKLDKLNEIEKVLKCIEHNLNTNYTDVALLKKDVDNLTENYKTSDNDIKKRLDIVETSGDGRYIELDKRINSLTVKVTSVAVTISTIAYVITYFLGK